MRRGILAVALLVPASAHAGGLFVGESGSQAMERGGAFVAKADDPTALWINPAGLTRQSGISVYAGANVVDYSLTVDRSGVYEPTEVDPEPAYVGQELAPQTDGAPIQPVPGLAAVYVIDRQAPTLGKIAIALGVFGPQGVPGREFECTEDDCLLESGAPNPVRYDVITQEALIVLPSLAVAVDVTPRISVGLRGSLGFGSVKARSFTWGVRNRNEYVEKDGDFRVDVTDSFIPAFGAGVHIRATDNLEIGLAYASAVKLRGKGTGVAILGDALGLGDQHDEIVPVDDAFAACAPGGTQAQLKACLNLEIPQTAAIGARWVFRDPAGRERGDVELDAKWENWSNASDIEVIVDGESMLTGLALNQVFIRHGFDDVIATRLGGSWRFDFGLELRGGVAYDTAAAPTTWTRADMDGKSRVTTALGAAYAFGGGRYRVDLGFAAVIEPDVTVDEFPDPAMDQPQPERVRPDPIQPLSGPNNQVQSPFNSGTYESGYLIGMFGFTGSF